MNKTIKVVGALLGAILLCISVLLATIVFTYGHSKRYITTDIADYGKYTGNYDDASVREFITTFFPDEIESTFSNVQYSYRAQKNDTYAFEAYLSFTIHDREQYNAFVENHTTGLMKSKFRYDDSCWEYTVADEFYPETPKDGDSDIHIRYAKIGKILCFPDEQEVIFVALGVYDGGVATTGFLCAYFDRFQIDPREYALHAIPAHK